MRHTTLESALKQMTDEENNSKDFLIPRIGIKLQYNADTNTTTTSPRLLFDSGKTEPERMELNEWSHSQLASKLDIPIKYYNKMMHSEHRLFEDNVNTWLHKPKMDGLEKTEKYLIRSCDNKVRGILSSKYKPISNSMVTAMTLKTLTHLQETQNIQFETKEIAITDQHIFLKFTSNNGFMMNEKTKDIWYPGVMIRNSEVGASMFKVDVYTWRQWCKNGAILTNGISKVHMGKRIEGNGEIRFSEMTEQLQTAAFLSGMTDVIKQIFVPENMAALLNRIKAGQEVPIENPERAVEIVSKRFKLSDFETKSMIERFQTKSQYGVGNSVTELGRDTTNENRQIELETIGGEIL